MTSEQRKWLQYTLHYGKDKVTRFYYEGRFDETVYEAYLALWWYGAIRFSDRPSEYPYVADINRQLDQDESELDQPREPAYCMNPLDDPERSVWTYGT